MAAHADPLVRFFGASRSHGLSGGAEPLPVPTLEDTPFASRARQHASDADVLAQPEAAWAQGDQIGLRAHVLSERLDGVTWGDVLVVVDAATAARHGQEAFAAVANLLEERHAAWARAERIPLRRPARVQVLADGSAALHGANLGLRPGEFVTVLSPTVHVPHAGSIPVLHVHLALPGAWEGYREIGCVHDDQLLYTVGAHWLDTFRHPSLREACLYVVQRRPDGAVVHQVPPSLQHRYVVRVDPDPGTGASILTIATREGAAVAHLVLVEAETAQVASITRPRIRRMERGSVRTVVPDDVGVRMLTLQERGALLQKVHFGAFMDGYDVHVGDGARVSTRMDHPRATLQVRGGTVSLQAHTPGVTFDGIPLPIGAPVPLDGAATLAVDGHELGWRPLKDVTVDGWPYLGEVRRRGGGASLPFGGHHRIGRDRRCTVHLPDEPWNGNIAWKDGVGTGTTIRSRQGDIPKARFYIDSIMVASEHAEVDLTGTPTLRSLARQCYTYLRRGGAVIALHPREGGRGAVEHALEPGDEVLVGNCLYEVQFAPEAPVLPAAIAMAPPALTLDVPAAARLGESGPAPRNVLDGPSGVHARPDLGKAPAVPAAIVQAPPVRATVSPRKDDTGARALLPEPVSVIVEEAAARRMALLEPVTAPLPPMSERLVPPDTLPHALPLSEDGIARVGVHEAAAELQGGARLVLEGWSIEGELVLGNHEGVDAVLPEIVTTEDAAFLPMEVLLVRPGGKGRTRAEVLASGEASLTRDGQELDATDEGEHVAIRVIRRDADFEPLHVVVLCVLADLSLPGGRRLAIASEPEALGGLTTRAAPLGAWRTVRLADAQSRVFFDGVRLHVAEFPAHPVMARSLDGPWMASHEGRAVLSPGDRLRVGCAIWRFDGIPAT